MERKNYDIGLDSESYKRQSTDSPQILSNLNDTLTFGRALIQNIPELNILLLKGALGAGKTSLVKGIGLGLGIKEPITSPTFALAQHYSKGFRPLIHLDLYRLTDYKAANEFFFQEEEEATTLGALIVIEWPERLSLNLTDAWEIKLDYLTTGGRTITVRAPQSKLRKS